jgi:hypothetical protein
MKFFCSFACASVILFLLSFSPARAETAGTDASVGSSLNELSIGLDGFAKNFSLELVLKTIDEGMGGFVFWTPDFFANKIKLKNGVAIEELAGLRDLFFRLAIPIIAIMIAINGIRMIGSDDSALWKPFIEKIILVIFLLLLTPYLLSLTIWANNLMVEGIFVSSGTSERKLLSLEYQEFMDKNFLPAESGPSFPKELNSTPSQKNSTPESLKQMFLQTLPSIIGPLGFIGYFATGQSQPPGQAASTFTVKLLGTIILFFLLIISLAVVTLQCVARFLSLLLLSIIYPLAMPFVMLEKTKQVVETYFKTWVSFLIQQPAFVLGYVIVFAAVRSLKGQMLNFDDSGMGLLLFNLGALVFIGSTPILTSHLFSETWALSFTAERGTQIRRTIESTLNSLARGQLSSLKRKGIGGILAGKTAKNLGLLPRVTPQASKTTPAFKFLPNTQSPLNKIAPNNKSKNKGAGTDSANEPKSPLPKNSLPRQRADIDKTAKARTGQSTTLNVSSALPRVKNLRRLAAIKSIETKEPVPRKIRSKF